MADDEISALLESDLLPSPFPANEGIAFVQQRTRFGIRLRSEHTKLVGKQFDQDIAAAGRTELEHQDLLLQSVLHALRILRAGTVAPAGHLTTSEAWFMRGSRSYGRSMVTPTAWANNYSLSQPEGEALRQLWTKLLSQRVKRRRALALAIRRFSLADDRMLADDKLLDLMISAEALLLTDSGSEQDRGELTYRLSLRAAFLLSNDPAERREIFKHMRRAYSARSQIAHGGEVSSVKLGDGTTIDLLSFTNATQQKIRQMILVMIDRVPEQGPMMDWESLILGPGVRQQ